jgi:podocalyxin-like protein 2
VRATEANGHCYLGFPGVMNALDALLFCDSLAAHLVSITSEAENNVARAASLLDDTPWIGLTDALVEGSFGWITSETLDFNGFEPGQPDDSFGNEDCAHFFDAATSPTGATHTWNDTNCDFVGFVTGLICEIDP